MKRNSIAKFVLETLLELGKVPLEAFFPPNYYYTRPYRKFLGLDSYPQASPRTISTTLSKLKKQGLVSKTGVTRNSMWFITKKGEKLSDKYNLLTREIPPKDGVSRLVIFDIPEKERKKRDRLRTELISCDFRRLQKSVWIGDNPLPHDFIEFLDNLKLANKVHVFSIRERGTVEEN